MFWELFGPLIQLVRKRMEFVQRKLVASFGGIEVFECLGENSCDAEKSYGTGDFGNFARQGR